jgi:hypothetical protein
MDREKKLVVGNVFNNGIFKEFLMKKLIASVPIPSQKCRAKLDVLDALDTLCASQSIRQVIVFLERLEARMASLEQFSDSEE